MNRPYPHPRLMRATYTIARVRLTRPLLGLLLSRALRDAVFRYHCDHDAHAQIVLWNSAHVMRERFGSNAYRRAKEAYSVAWWRGLV